MKRREEDLPSHFQDGMDERECFGEVNEFMNN